MISSRLALAMVLLAAQLVLLVAVLFQSRASADWRRFFIAHHVACWPGGSGAPAAAPRHCLLRSPT